MEWIGLAWLGSRYLRKEALGGFVSAQQLCIMDDNSNLTSIEDVISSPGVSRLINWINLMCDISLGYEIPAEYFKECLSNITDIAHLKDLLDTLNMYNRTDLIAIFLEETKGIAGFDPFEL